MAPTKPLIEYVYSQSGRSINARMNEAHLRSNGYEQVVDQLLETTADFADMTFTERLRMFVFDKIRVNHCKTCGTELRVWKKDDWKAFCSRSCAQNDPENKARMLAGQSTVDWTEKVKKREDTMQNTYGYTTYSKTEDAKKRFTERTKEAWSTPERKAQRIQRRIETNIGRYGREHTSQRPEQRIISGQAISKAYQEKSDGVKKEIIDKYRRTRLNSYVYDCLNNKTFLEEMCVDKRLSSLAISKILNCANSAVCYAIDRFNIPYDPIQQRSLLECELYEFVKSIYPAAIQSYRDIKEIDVFISECNFGFEFNGVYWHSEAKRHMTYHVEKINYFYDRDIHYVQIWEDDWLNKQDVVKTFIKKLLMPQMCIDLGETTIIDITYEDFSKFIDEYDLRGSEYADIMLALVDDDYNMLAAIGFNYASDNNIEIVRYADIGVSNAFECLIKHIEMFFDMGMITVIVDLEITDRRSNIYTSTGFVVSETFPIDYKYYNYRVGSLEDKDAYRLSEFQKLGFDITNKTERELALEYGLLRCYDSGKIKYAKKIDRN